jgi:hypothetical protein
VRIVLATISMILFLTNISYAGPFGLQMGTPLENLTKQYDLHELQSFIFIAGKPPKAHPDFDDFMFIATPKHGLCKVIASSKPVVTNSYGHEFKRKFEDLENSLEKKYGRVVIKKDFIVGGSIWDKPQYWMVGLSKHERTLESYWNSVKQGYPDNIASVGLTTTALDTETGRIELTYEFKNIGECLDYVKAIKDKPL